MSGDGGKARRDLEDFHAALVAETKPGHFIPLKNVSAMMYDAIGVETRRCVYEKLVVMDDKRLVKYQKGKGVKVLHPA